MDFEYKEEYKYLTNICLNLTDACNCECKYCFVEQQPHYMTYEVAQAAVDFIVENLKKKNEERGHITYFGGEPTIMWDEIIVPLTNYIKENNLPIDLGITTNGTLLNEERIKFLYDNNITPLLSIDGDRETQEFNRPCRTGNSFDLVMENIPILLKYFPNTTFRGTIYAPTAKNTFQNYLFAVKLGFKKVFFIPDVRHPWTIEQMNSLQQEIHKIFSYMDFCFSNGFKPISFSIIDDMFQTMLKKDLEIYLNKSREINISRKIYRCGLGITQGSIGYDGSIYSCQEQDSKKINNIFYLGNIFKNGIDIKLHKKLLETYSAKSITYCENKELCDNCPLRRVCVGFNCPSSTYDLFQNFFTSTEINCYWYRWIYEDCVVLNNKLVQQNNLLFKFYLDEQCEFKNKRSETNNVLEL